MKDFQEARRHFLQLIGFASAAIFLSPKESFANLDIRKAHIERAAAAQNDSTSAADYTLHIKESPIEIAPKRILSLKSYNGQFPGPLLRFREGQSATVAIYNDTDTPEQLHWHGQKVSTDVDGAAEEGTPFIPAHGKRVVTFTPNPSGLRFYHTHNRAGADLYAGQYSGEVGPVYSLHRTKTRSGCI
jgi:FtsP/CotA-like multicopper oxidase with cupredoxin domain